MQENKPGLELKNTEEKVYQTLKWKKNICHCALMEMPYKCDQFDYAFSDLSALSQHLKRHKVEKIPFQLQPAQLYSFSSCPFKDTLDETQWRKTNICVKIHGAGKSKKCYQCNNAPSCPSDLMKQMKKHNREDTNKWSYGTSNI